MSKRNNPRAFAEVVSIEAWRTEFSGDKAEADLHIDVGFFTGRMGGDEFPDSPVRFTVSLKRAEIHVSRDQAGVLQIPPSSVKRASVNSSTAKTTKTIEAEAQGAAAAGLGTEGASLKLDAGISGKTQVTKTVETEEELGKMRFSHRVAANGDGYVFVIEPIGADALDGNPWDSASPAMRIRDTKSSRKRGEPPEVIVEIKCKREDLKIENIEFKNKTVLRFDLLGREKKIAVEQYIKKVILEMGLPCGDISEPFATIVLGDAISWKE